MPEKISYLRFNPDCKFLSVGTSQGWKLFSVENPKDAKVIQEGDHNNGGVRIFERPPIGAVAAVVETTSPRKLTVININTKKDIYVYYFPSSVLSVRLSKDRLVVLLEDNILFYAIPQLNSKTHMIRLEHPNPLGLMELCSNEEGSLLVYPTSGNSGIISVYDCVRNVHIRDIAAHSSSIACMAVDSTGSLVATASEKGTLIRIFAVRNGEKQFEFRRGVLRNAAIASMVFSPDNKFLAISSDTETIHIFKLHQNQQQFVRRPAQREDDSWFGWFRSSLPTPVADILNEERAFATINKTSVHKSILGFHMSALSPSSVVRDYKLLVASYDGYIYAYDFDADVGGECRLTIQHMFVQTPASSPHAETGGSRSNLTDSFAIGRLPDILNQGYSVGCDYGIGLVQSVVGASQTFLDNTGFSGASAGSRIVDHREQEVD